MKEEKPRVPRVWNGTARKGALGGFEGSEKSMSLSKNNNQKLRPKIAFKIWSSFLDGKTETQTIITFTPL